MDGHAAPGQSFHVGHGRLVVGAGMMYHVLLQDGEHSCGCLVSLLARGNGRAADAHAVAVDVERLFAKTHDDGHRTGGRDLWLPHVIAGLEVRCERLLFFARFDVLGIARTHCAEGDG